MRQIYRWGALNRQGSRLVYEKAVGLLCNQKRNFVLLFVCCTMQQLYGDMVCAENAQE